MPEPSARPPPRPPTRPGACALLIAGLAAALPACKRPAPPPDAAALARAPLSPAASPRPSSRCDEPAPGATFSLGEDHGQDDDALPFSVELGDGTAFAGGFAVGALSPSGHRGSEAVVVTTSLDGTNSRVISLGAAGP